jgi:hypothetical protein
MSVMAHYTTNELLELLDNVLMSNNPTVMKAFENLVIVTKLSESNTHARGPIRLLLDSNLNIYDRMS